MRLDVKRGVALGGTFHNYGVMTSSGHILSSVPLNWGCFGF